MRIKVLVAIVVVLATVLQSCMQKSDEVKLIPVKSGDKWGYVDNEGKFVINAQFEDAFNFSEGLALFKTSENKFGYIGEDGKYVINPIYKRATKFSEGLAVVVMENGKPQVINKEGKILFTVDKVDFCSGFKEGMARVKNKGKWGFIDITGKIIVNPSYEYASNFNEGLASVAIKDEKTDELKWGYIDKTGSVKINFQFCEDKEKLWCKPDVFREGLAFVSTDGKQWGCIGKEGKYEINPQFEGAEFSPYGFYYGVSLVSQAGSFGFVDKKGKYVINPQFKEANRFSANGLAAVQNSDDKWGFVNSEGKYVINPQFDDVENGFIGDIAFVKSSEKYGIINSKGLYVINPQFDDVKLLDIDAIYGVESDYVDNIAIAEEVFKLASPDKFLGFGSKTNLGDIIDKYPSTDVDKLEERGLEVENPDLELSELIDVLALNYGFNDETYSLTPVYKTVQRYNYFYGNYYADKEFDHFDKKIQYGTLLSSIHLVLKVKSSGSNKGKDMAEALKNMAAEKMKLTLVPASDSANTKESGLYSLSNDKIMFNVTYFEAEEDYEYPVISIYVLNKNSILKFNDAMEFLRASLQRNKEDE